MDWRVAEQVHCSQGLVAVEVLEQEAQNDGVTIFEHEMHDVLAGVLRPVLQQVPVVGAALFFGLRVVLNQADDFVSVAQNILAVLGTVRHESQQRLVLLLALAFSADRLLLGSFSLPGPRATSLLRFPILLENVHF